MKNTVLKIALVAALTNGVAGCAYDAKEYPRESWFGTDTALLSPKDFSRAETPLPVSLQVTYRWEGQPVDDARLDWHERYGLWLAAKRYLEETGLVQVVEEVSADGTRAKPVIPMEGRPGNPPAALLTIAVDRSLSEQTKQALARRKETGAGEKTVYIYETRSTTDSMSVGHADSPERQRGAAPERFDFSFFNNMEFHTEFVRRFYRQMLFEALSKMEQEKAFSGRP